AERFEMGSSENLPQTLMATAFRGQNVSPDQMTALLVVANQHGLNPWTNEIYAFPNNGGIVPIVGVDGWSRIMNDHPQFDGIEFTFNDDNSCTCNIYRKDRTRPTTVTEYMNECSRNTQPWKSHPKRMLRHKAMIQCARLAFGFTGIYDQDEAERIVENQKEPLNVTPKPNVI
ncbi:phage recombination protein Bet, partial [Avibacterium paragallinarum]